MHDFKKLNVWQKSRQLVKDIYEVTQNFPKEEMYGLTSQIRRSAVSIPSNIAERCGRETDKDTSHFMTIAMGSSFELETQVILACDLGYIGSKVIVTDLWNRIDEVQKMIDGFRKSLGK